MSLGSDRHPIKAQFEIVRLPPLCYLGPMRSVLVAIALLLAAVVIAEAQQAKILQIGYLSGTDPATAYTRTQAIRSGLRELGYVEGQNIAIHYRYAEGKSDRYSEHAAEMVRLRVDVIVVAGGILPLRAAKNATKTIPIVMTGQGLDPVEAGLVESLARPGGNITGPTTWFAGELVGKRLELLKEAVPKISRVAILYDSLNPSSEIALKGVLPASARVLGLTLQPWEVHTLDEFDRVFAALNKQRPDGLQILGGGLPNTQQKRIADFALKSRLPSIYNSKEAVNVGGLMSYGPDEAEVDRLVAWYIDKILKGAKPAELPLQQPMKFEFAVNLKTAKQIGITIPQSVLFRTTKVIK
jgi:putative tryptophan/tyrosine transport system substrate-binding protein